MKIFNLLILLLAITTQAQQSAKSIGINRLVTGYVVQTIAEKDTTYQRIDRHQDLPKNMVKSKLKDYPVSLLKQKETYQSHLRRN